ncbi:hypothetical protein Zmor_016706 [Zophobas morio]|uniref:Uncharacterized protein n=1 Tax=Zophobas morio TaxID=2755281 RepID=A0AA38MBQ6_9CUCU|nr:hypothetical protein Zmor_016706 [Zophobas morio]
MSAHKKRRYGFSLGKREECSWFFFSIEWTLVTSFFEPIPDSADVRKNGAGNCAEGRRSDWTEPGNSLDGFGVGMRKSAEVVRISGGSSGGAS